MVDVPRGLGNAVRPVQLGDGRHERAENENDDEEDSGPTDFAALMLKIGGDVESAYDNHGALREAVSNCCRRGSFSRRRRALAIVFGNLISNKLIMHKFG